MADTTTTTTAVNKSTYTERYASRVANPKFKKLNLRLSRRGKPSNLLRQDVGSFREAALVATEWARKNHISKWECRSHDVFVGCKACCRVDINTGEVKFTRAEDPRDAYGDDWVTVYHPDSDPTWQEEKVRILEEEKKQARIRGERKRVAAKLVLQSKQNALGEAAQKMLTIAKATSPNPFNLDRCQEALDLFMSGRNENLSFGYYGTWGLKWSFPSDRSMRSIVELNLRLDSEAKPELVLSILSTSDISVEDFSVHLPAIMQAVLMVKAVTEKFLNGKVAMRETVAQQLAEMQVTEDPALQKNEGEAQ